jgi:hypothetical protein
LKWRNLLAIRWRYENQQLIKKDTSMTEKMSGFCQTIKTIGLAACATGMLLGTAPRALCGPSPSYSVISATYGDGYYTPQTIGYSFTPNENITVTDLGFLAYLGGGLAESHEVGIYDTSGDLLASALVPAGTAAPLTGDFRYVAIPDLDLTAGTEYICAGLMNTTADNVGYSSPSDISLDSRISISADPSLFTIGGSGIQFPTTPGISATFYVGPNFEIENATGSVPDGASVFTLVIAGGFILSLRRLKRVSA